MMRTFRMRSRLSGLLLAMLALGMLVPVAHAKRFRYSSGPVAPADSVLSEGDRYLEPIVRSRGPRVPYTNLQLTALVADSAGARALAGMPVESGQEVVLAPAHDHPLNFVVEHSLLRELTRRGIAVSVRHTPLSDDSLATVYGRAGEPVLEYTLGSAKVSYVRLVGWLPGRVKIERQSLVQGTLALRDPLASRVLWTGDFGQNYLDRFARNEQSLVEDARYPDLKDDTPGRSVDKLVEPVIVVAIVGGLIALFFQNKP
jgi:hypothetical protein